MEIVVTTTRTTYSEKIKPGDDGDIDIKTRRGSGTVRIQNISDVAIFVKMRFD